MRSSAALFIVGMFVAAIVGIAASFGMQSVLPVEVAGSSASDGTEVLTTVMKGETSKLERSMQEKIGELTASVDTLSSQMSSLREDVQGLKVRLNSAGSASAPIVAGGQPVADPNIDSVINRVLDDRDKRREEEREAERTQRATEMRDRFKGMMTERTDRYAQEKGWDAGKTEQVKQIMSNYMEKMSELGGGMMFGRRRGGRGSEEDRAKMTQLREETMTSLLAIISEEEANEIMRSGMGGGPGGDRRGGQDGNQRGGPGGGRGGR